MNFDDSLGSCCKDLQHFVMIDFNKKRKVVLPWSIRNRES